MECKAPLPLPLLEGKNVPPLMQVYFEFNHLKQLYRQGWLHRGITTERCETVAEHTFGVAVLAFLLADAYFPHLDSGRVLRMALIHDFGEIYTGDITPQQGVTSAEKHRQEREAVTRIFGRLPNGQQYLELWEEYEQADTPEAHFVRQVDRLEMAFQASVYEHQELANLSEFFETARQALSDPELADLMASLTASRSGPAPQQG